LWTSAQAVDSLTKQIEAALAISGGPISADTNFSDLGIDSLEMVEMVMEIDRGI
jgi:acyl carrier protein